MHCFCRCTVCLFECLCSQMFFFFILYVCTCLCSCILSCCVCSRISSYCVCSCILSYRVCSLRMCACVTVSAKSTSFKRANSLCCHICCKQLMLSYMLQTAYAVTQSANSLRCHTVCRQLTLPYVQTAYAVALLTPPPPPPKDTLPPLPL